MQISQQNARRTGQAPRYQPVEPRQHLSLREAALLICYQVRLLNAWLFFLMLLGFLASGALFWCWLRLPDAQGARLALTLSRFVLESGVGLLAGMLASALVAGDPLLEVSMATHGGVFRLVLWRSLLSFVLLLGCSAVYLGWTLLNGLAYAQQQNALFLLLLWLVPVLLLGMLGLGGSLVTGNSALGLVIAALPLAGELIFHGYFLPIQGTHPFFIPYTLWRPEASDWWANRLSLLGLALLLAAGNWWYLRREERLLSDAR